MPYYVHPKSVEVVTGGDGTGLIAVLLGAAGIIGIGVFIVAHIVALVLGLVGIAAVLGVETYVLHKRFAMVSWTPAANEYVARALAAQQARLAGEPIPTAVPGMTVEVEVVRPAKAATPAVEAPARRPAIAPPYRTIPGYVLNDDGQRVAIQAKQGGPTHAA